jgi:hypothetical protein
MTAFLYVTADGKIVGNGSVPECDIERLQPIENTVLVFNKVGDPIEGCYYDFSNGQVVFDTNKPGKYYAFNYQDKLWVLDSFLAENDIRKQRILLLQNSDWTDTASAPARLGQELYDQWQTYRQALRDVTAQPGYPFEVVWPTPPQ